MKNEVILKKAASVSADEFAKFLDGNNIYYSILDCNLLNYNNDWFNLVVDAGTKSEKQPSLSVLYCDGSLVEGYEV